MKTPSLERRLTIAGLVLIATTLVAVNAFVYLSVRSHAYAELEQRLDSRARVAATIAADATKLGRLAHKAGRGAPGLLLRKRARFRNDELVRRLGGDGVDVHVTGPKQGFSIFIRNGRLAGHGEVAFVTPLGFDNWRARRTDDRLWVTAWLPAVARVVTLSVSTRGVERALSQLLVGQVVVSLLLLFAGALALRRLVRVALRPLERISEVARDIAGGRRDARLAPTRADTQLGRLASAFDEMVDALEESAARTRRFVADASHELRTPVAGLQSGLELALASDRNGRLDERLVSELLRESKRLGRLVDDLLAVERLDEGFALVPSHYDLADVVQQEVLRAQARSPAAITLSTPDSCPLDGDPTRVAQIVANLLENACRATPAGGRIDVDVRPLNGCVEVEVADTGPGVPSDERERIFERFVRLNGARTDDAGSGLGLTIARGLARAHGGALHCAESNAGARFVLALPRSEGAAVP